MKVDITRKLISLNEEKLEEEIHKFEYKTNQKACLFMSADTLKILFASKSPYCIHIFSESIIHEFKGRRIYQNDDLKFGEVDIK